MKSIVLLATLACLIISEAASQPCLPDGINFTTQSQIDNFQTNYPNCTEIEGDVRIEGEDINNLNGLSPLTSIGGGLSITSTENLASLSGLDNLTWIGGDLSIGSFHINAIPGGLECEGNLILADLTALSNLTHIGGDLQFYCNESLENLSGLESVTTIGGSLRIGYAHEDFTGLQLAGNQSLTDITGLQEVLAIGGDIDIQGNISLQSLSGLQNIDPASVENVTIRNNSSLSNCEALGLCDYMISPQGSVEIYENAEGCDNPYEVAVSCGNTLPCLPFGNYYFFSQADIDNFNAHYPGCSALEGDVIIKGDDIDNLIGLSTVTSIGGDLSIVEITKLDDLTGLGSLQSVGGEMVIGSDGWFGSGNPLLKNLSGLNNLSTVGDGLFIAHNDSLTSLSGLENLSSVGDGLSISDNDSLTSLSGLENLSSVDGRLIIESNGLLTNLKGLNNLTSIGDGLWIQYNYTLISLEGLENLIFVNGRLSIHSNPALTSLMALSSVDPGSVSVLAINENTSLSSCEVSSVCDFLSNPYIGALIYDNAPGCNSPWEVLDSCLVSVEEINAEAKVSIYPNPFNASVHIEYELKNAETVEIIMYNQLGEQLEVFQQTGSQGKQQVVWNAEGLPPGVYFCLVKTAHATQTMKMVKLKY